MTGRGLEVTRFPSGSIVMPPSKSLSHRAIIAATLAGDGGLLRVKNVGVSDDVTATRRCVLGATLCGGQGGVLDCGGSGSTLRFLLPLSAVYGGADFVGDTRLLSRPLAPLVETLRAHGVSVERVGERLRVGGRLTAGRFDLRGDVSSQFVTGLLFALPLLEGDSEIDLTTPPESTPYIDMTIEVMRRFGVEVACDGDRRFMVRGAQRYTACDYTIDGDYSQAAFFLAASAMGCECTLLGLGQYPTQGDSAIVDILRNSGVTIDRDGCGVTARAGGRFAAQTVDVSDTPDLVPPLAVFFATCDGTSRIVGGRRLRFKESDRLATVSEELNRLGANVILDGDDMVIVGVERLRGGHMSARRQHADHRLAMMGAVAAVRCEAPVFVDGWRCVDKSYPNFWRDFGFERL